MTDIQKGVQARTRCVRRLTRLWESGHTWVMADSACVQAAHMQNRAKGTPPSLPPQAATILQGDTSTSGLHAQ